MSPRHLNKIRDLQDFMGLRNQFLCSHYKFSILYYGHYLNSRLGLYLDVLYSDHQKWTLHNLNTGHKNISSILSQYAESLA